MYENRIHGFRALSTARAIAAVLARQPFAFGRKSIGIELHTTRIPSEKNGEKVEIVERVYVLVVKPEAIPARAILEGETRETVAAETASRLNYFVQGYLLGQKHGRKSNDSDVKIMPPRGYRMSETAHYSAE